MAGMPKRGKKGLKHLEKANGKELLTKKVKDLAGTIIIADLFSGSIL